MTVSDKMLLTFHPPSWGAVEFFHSFQSTTYKFNKRELSVLSGVTHHFNKAMTLLKLAEEHAPLLEEDHAEMDTFGHSPSSRGQELSALIEAMILELYSATDCSQKVVYFIYRNKRCVTSSTRKFFRAVLERKISEVPELVLEAFLNAEWYPEFMRLRDALVHSSTGRCYLDRNTKIVRYMHSDLGSYEKSLVIDDVFAHLKRLAHDINQFMGKVFAGLIPQLCDNPVFQVCGTYKGLLYARDVKPSEASSLGGRCLSYEWFEKDGKQTCPLAYKCLAYKNVKEQDS